ncbi:hypothetical protein [Mediterraneibacter gnavus]|uniref:hypothetical protein n=1 Tax=Mediterraneibacter gnavus TaxID=33038 RepID=UPI0036D3BCF0
MSIGLYIVLAPLYLKSVRKLQEKRFVFVKILAIIIPENGAKVSKIKCFQFAQQTLTREQFDTEYKIFQQIGSTSIFYKTDHEISEMLPKLRMNMNSAINIAQLNKYADEYVRWSDIIQEENKDVLEEF